MLVCRTPTLRSKPVSKQQQVLRRQHLQTQQCCQSSRQHRQRRNATICAAAATAELETKKATVKIGTRGSPLALAQAYMTRDFLKASTSLRHSAGMPLGISPYTAWLWHRLHDYIRHLHLCPNAYMHMTLLHTIQCGLWQRKHISHTVMQSQAYIMSMSMMVSVQMHNCCLWQLLIRAVYPVSGNSDINLEQSCVSDQR